MANDIAVLHQWEVSPFCGKVRRILDEKKIPYKTKNYNGRLAPLAAKLSDVGKLPVLDINGERISDSHKIAQYLEDNFPDRNPLIPENKKEKAQMKIYQDWAGGSLYWYCFFFRFNYDDAWNKTAEYFSKGRPAFEKQIVKSVGRIQYLKQLKGHGISRYPKHQVEADFIELIKQLEETLSDQQWLVGEKKTLADIAVASQLHEIKRTSHMADHLTALPSLTDWLNRI